MIFLKIIEWIFLALTMIITLLCFIMDDIKEMCFFEMLSTWLLIDMANDRVINKLK